MGFHWGDRNGPANSSSWEIGQRGFPFSLLMTLLVMNCAQCAMVRGLYGRGVRTGPMMEPRPEDCAITILEKGDSLPYGAREIGEVEATDYRSGPLEDLLPELKRQACALGGVAITRVEYRRYQHLRSPHDETFVATTQTAALPTKYGPIGRRLVVAPHKRAFRTKNQQKIAEINQEIGKQCSMARALVYYVPDPLAPLRALDNLFDPPEERAQEDIVENSQLP